jgi:hypothetical protein
MQVRAHTVDRTRRERCSEPLSSPRSKQRNEAKQVKSRLAIAAIVTTTLGAVLVAPSAAVASEVGCGDNNFVRVIWHNHASGSRVTCFAGAGKNWFRGETGQSSYMTDLRTGNNEITFEDCNGTTIDYRRGFDEEINPAKCVAWINIKPY